ncbi:MAG TPA: DUF1553 domain-containing protein [Verrucomicrobiae bacterium]
MPRKLPQTTVAGEPSRFFGLWPAANLLILLSAPAWGGTNAPVLFNRDIRPILSDNCFPCHGFDASKRKAELRLDTAEGATTPHKGRLPINGGDLETSEVWRRVSSRDPKIQMPPPESARKLKPDEITTIRDWIVQGAAYQKHWAFDPPVRPEPPAVADLAWVRNEIDRFILSTLAHRGMAPSPEASRETLIRRVTLDLTGLPPGLEEVDTFLADHSPDAYEKLVDRLLASPRYGEQMARYWLDVARYGDTHGLHLDNERSIWPYRDWVVAAFNGNLPFDQFTIWQLAGDLLPDATREQKVASGFNRCNVSTSEGGAIDEEFQARYAVDRVETTSAAWLGLTMGCAVCHDHKLDPITQKEFYEVFAIFNNLADKAMDGNALLPPPSLQLPTPAQEKEVADLDPPIREFEKRIKDLAAALKYNDPAALTNLAKPEPREILWLDDAFPAKAEVTVLPAAETNFWIGRTNGQVLQGERSIHFSGKGLHRLFFTNAEPLAITAGDRLLAHVYLDPTNPPRALMLEFQADDWDHRANWGEANAIASVDDKLKDAAHAGTLPESNRWVRLEISAAKLGFRPGTRITGLGLVQLDGNVYWDQVGQVEVNDPAENPDLSLIAWEKFERELGDKSKLPQEIKDLLHKEAAKREAADREKLTGYFLAWVYADIESGLPKLRSERKPLKDRREALEKEISATMVSQELEKPRPTWVLTRGQYDKHGEQVGPGVPAILPPLPSGDVTNRLTFARWLTDPQHPLTARVTVNRFWQQLFGTGLVKTSEDFGTRGEWPSHPELLDWLATEFSHTGWDVKRMLRLMVTSATYRQDSRVTPALARVDPENRWLARGPRHRLDAEVLRDYALDASGLINLKMGGRGVRPYQPPGIWEAVGYTTSNTAKYEQDHGDALYRRSLYLFWKRTAPPPTMTTFDAPSREQCRVRRERTNTPLQALLTMNDPQYFEAARQLGYRIWHDGGTNDLDRLRLGFRLITARQPTNGELAVLSETLSAQRGHYAADPEAARKVVAVGEAPVPDDVPAPELAAYSMIANLLLNLDEAVTQN